MRRERPCAIASYPKTRSAPARINGRRAVLTTGREEGRGPRLGDDLIVLGSEDTKMCLPADSVQHRCLQPERSLLTGFPGTPTDCMIRSTSTPGRRPRAPD